MEHSRLKDLDNHELAAIRNEIARHITLNGETPVIHGARGKAAALTRQQMQLMIAYHEPPKDSDHFASSWHKKNREDLRRLLEFQGVSVGSGRC